ncbi:Etoposide-induced [Trema orientale]|uniref:Etoposide-induced n=1 Tax=Trema orientale TaxID=63057 RepID=A0A2P5EEF7_TREOI|nr:Etoposide-induced [Trema orientale]
MWYNDIAEHGFAAAERSDPMKVDPLGQEDKSPLQNTAHVGRHGGLGGVMIGIGEQVYSLLLLIVFFLEVVVTGYVPYIGRALKFLLLSWIYAYYCFEYKWNLSQVDLDKRLNFFESNWAFFAGFGSPCVLPVLFFSPLVTYGIMAILFPLFVLTATGSDAEKVISSQRNKWGEDAGLGRLPIFKAANAISMRVLSLFPLGPREQLKDNKVE